MMFVLLFYPFELMSMFLTHPPLTSSNLLLNTPSHLDVLHTHPPSHLTHSRILFPPTYFFFRLEAALSEQDTVVQVYRADMIKNSLSIVQAQSVSTNTPMKGISGLITTPTSKHGTVEGVGGLASTGNFPPPPLGVDKAALGIWQQFAAKFGAMRSEVSKWTSLQDALLNALTTLSSEVTGVANGYNSSNNNNNNNNNNDDNVRSLGQGQGQEDKSELARGLLLLQRQLTERQQKCELNFTKTREHVVHFDTLGNDLLTTLNKYEGIIAATVEEEETWASPGNEE